MILILNYFNSIEWNKRSTKFESKEEGYHDGNGELEKSHCNFLADLWLLKMEFPQI